MRFRNWMYVFGTPFVVIGCWIMVASDSAPDYVFNTGFWNAAFGVVICLAGELLDDD